MDLLGAIATAAFLYSLSVFVVGCIVYVACNPYGHITNREQWQQTIQIALIWPFWLLYVIGMVVYYDHIEPWWKEK